MKLLLFFLISNAAFAQSNQDYCGLNAPQPDVVIPSNDVSGNYWTNLLDDHTLMFTAEGGTADSAGYQAYDLNEKKAYKLTTEIDPFPAPDGRRIYIHPQPIQFFEFDKVVKLVKEGRDQDKLVNEVGISDSRDKEARQAEKDKRADSNYNAWSRNDDEKKSKYMPRKDFEYGDRDGQMWGYYQSMAVLKTSKKTNRNFSKYRILTGENEGMFSDYQVDFNADGTIKKVTSLTKAKLMCNNWRKAGKDDLDFDTPIMSPKGNEFAITDRKTNTTKIITFNPNTGDCSEAMDLGFEAGKIHFSPDGSKIAFHTQSLEIGSASVYTKNNRGYMLDRKKNTIVSLQVGGADEATSEQYPVFLPDGRIVYQRVKYEDGTQQRAWVIVDPEKLNKAQYQKVTEADCVGQDKNLPLLALGKLYKDICKDMLVKDDDLMWTLNMDPARCQKLVNDNWSASKDVITDDFNSTAKKKIPENYLSKEMLLAACPTKTPGPVKLVNLGDATKIRYPTVISEKCIVCHTQGSPNGYIPFDKPEDLRSMGALGNSAGPGKPFAGKTFLEQITTILESNVPGKTLPEGIPRMPAVGPQLQAEETKVILDWVNTGVEVK